MTADSRSKLVAFQLTLWVRDRAEMSPKVCGCLLTAVYWPERGVVAVMEPLQKENVCFVTLSYVTCQCRDGFPDESLVHSDTAEQE